MERNNANHRSEKRWLNCPSVPHSHLLQVWLCLFFVTIMNGIPYPYLYSYEAYGKDKLCMRKAIALSCAIHTLASNT